MRLEDEAFWEVLVGGGGQRRGEKADNSQGVVTALILAKNEERFILCEVNRLFFYLHHSLSLDLRLVQWWKARGTYFK